QVSTTRQIAVWYASLHVLMLNSAALAANKITASTAQSGVVKGADGEPTGQLNESPAMELATTIYDAIISLMGGAKTWDAFGTFARNSGCTTITDMASTMLADPAGKQVVVDTVGAESFPTRVGIYVDLTIGEGVTPDDIVATVLGLRETNGTDKLHFPGIKLVLDGSIQSFTAFMQWPGYYLGPNDQQELLLSPEETVGWITPLQAAGIQASVHCNGAETVEVFLDAVAEAERHTPAAGIRHVCQHSQLTTPAQYARMAELGVGANIFANHLWFWGDQHYEITVGPERAEGMDDAMSAAEHGVVYSFHTDAAVTPLGCLHSMWCAVNRVTPKGRVLGESRRISAEDALRAVTLGSAFLLGLDGELGSIETGKWADFTVLAENPLTVDPTHIRDIPVWGTVLGGVKQPGAGAAG
ncbi:MAG: amidohydrolase family protein, partial [Chloroflexota bacterium]|nr:amidohydrolase family protein [Chloroflexota bacterium]